MKRIAMLVLGIALLTGLEGCEHPYARLSTLQDPKYPVMRTSKIALPDSVNSPTVDLSTRLAGESVKAQLQALGFAITPIAQADFQLSFNVTDTDEPVTYNLTLPTMSTVTGAVGNREVYGTVMSDQVVPQTHMVDTTQLNVNLRRTQEPQVEVWSGRIAADAADAEKYRPAFYRALLERIGETAHGVVQLDDGQVSPEP